MHLRAPRALAVGARGSRTALGRVRRLEENGAGPSGGGGERGIFIVSRASRIYPRMRMRVRKWAGGGKGHVKIISFAVFSYVELSPCKMKGTKVQTLGAVAGAWLRWLLRCIVIIIRMRNAN